MNILLDTCAIIWAITKPERLSEKNRQALETKTNRVFFSPISAGEIACLAERKRVEFDRHWKTWFTYFSQLNGWFCQPITLEVILEAYSLPETFHQDPADRIIVATARKYDMAIATGDLKIIDYPHVKTL